MPSTKRNNAKPLADTFTVNDDGTIDLRVKETMIYLRCPTYGELQKLIVGHARLVKDLAENSKLLIAAQQELMAAAQTLAEEAPEGITPDYDGLVLPGGKEAHEYVLAQRDMVAAFWADQVIAVLADQKIAATDLPAFLTNAGSVARAVDGWYGLPSVPGDG